MRIGALWLLVFIWVLAAGGPAPAAQAAPVDLPGLGAPLNQATSLAMVSPASCPAGGCAAGQRLNLRFDFPLPAGSLGASDSPNVKVCLYAPAAWGIPLDARENVTGATTGQPYPLAADCAEGGPVPTNYSLIMARHATLDPTSFKDEVTAAFRLGRTAIGSGSLLARVMTNNGGWSGPAEAYTATLSTTPFANPAYVANNSSACGTSSPCYVNSGDDLALGLGTGLKDAVDAADAGAVVTILGSYSIKSNTVLVNRPLTITGAGDATLTYTGPGACSGAMLALNDAVTVRNLNINDGICTQPGRNLLEVNTANAVVIESNDLTSGDNAILVRANSGPVLVRFNHISGNTGYALLMEGTTGGALDMIANNLSDNRSGPAVECAENGGAIASRRVNHNFWGAVQPTADNSRCTVSPSKRLGAPITLRPNAPGVNAQLVSVTDSKTYAFDNQLAYRRSGGSNFSLYLVDHGYASPSGQPFTYAQGEESLSPCSATYDVFLPDGVNPGGSLELFLKYNRTTACEAVIESTQFCGQTTNMTVYPLYWYDPSGTTTRGWDTTGQRPERLTTGEGQVTACNVGSKELQVSIDNTGRPSLNADLNYTPFMVGLPVLRSFTPLASSQAVTLTWTTNFEPDIAGFYILTSLDGANFTQNPDLIQRTGTSFLGRSYFFSQSGLANGTRLYYRLRILRTDGISIYSAIESVVVNVATITPTFTASPVFTRTAPFPTFTPFPTRVFTQLPTRVPSATWTERVVSPSATAFEFDIIDGTPVPRSTIDLGTDEAYPPPEEGANETPTPEETLTPVPVDSATPAPTVVSGGSAAAQFAPWISLMLGMISSALLIAGTAGLWWWLRQRS